jgi:hypothetical protein
MFEEFKESNKMFESKKGNSKFKINGSDLKVLYATSNKGKLHIKLELYEKVNPKLTYYFELTPPSNISKIKKVYQIMIGGISPGGEGKIVLWEQTINKKKPVKRNSEKIEVYCKEKEIFVDMPLKLVELGEKSIYDPDEILAGVMNNKKIDNKQFKLKLDQ